MNSESAQSQANDGQSDLHDEASHWFLSLRNVVAGDRNITDFERWLAQSEAHANAYADVESAWSMLEDAAAAPEIVTARRDALSRARRAALFRWGAKRPRAAAIAASLLAALVISSIFLRAGGFFASGAQYVQHYETDIGETRVLTLADNSKISLDAKSSVDVRYTPQQRIVELQSGQAFFDVAKDPTRPFRVTAGGKTIVALGTAFNVELLNSEVFVTLVEGKVVVADADENGEKVVPGAVRTDISPNVKELAPGQRLIAKSSGATLIEPQADISKAIAWRRGKLVFEDDPLGLAIERMSKYSRITLIAGDKTTAALGVSGVFDAGDTEAFVEALEEYFGVRAERRADGAIVIRAQS